MNDELLLLEKLDEIDAVVNAHYESQEDIGVLAGQSGIAIFKFYYSKLKNDPESSDVGVEILASVIEKINNGYNQPGYCSGIAGAGWAIELLSEEGFIDIDCDDLLPLLDDFLVEFINLEQDNFYDFLHGVLGIGHYFLKRCKNTKSQQLREKYQGILQTIVTKLDDAAIHEKNHVKWESSLDRKAQVRGYNLSLAHGMSSIINFLSRLIAHEEISDDRPGLLLSKSVNYLLSKQIQTDSKTPTFPDWVFLNNEVNSSGRLAWCYGDFGLAVSLYQAGQVLVDTELSNIALDLLKSTTNRREPEDTKVVDAGICHGTAGLAQMYNYLYRETQDNDFKEAMNYWMNQTLAHANHSEGYAGYMQKRGSEEKPWHKELSLLEGVSGIGLSIISYLNPTESKWDQCLLIS